MIEHLWSVICERILLDSKTRTASYVNTTNAIPVSSVDNKTGAITLNPFIVVTKLHKIDKEEEEFSIRFALKSEEDQKREEVGIEKAKLESKAIFAELNMEITEMVVKKEGSYRFLIDLKLDSGRWKNIASLPILVKTKKKIKSSSKSQQQEET